MTTTALSIACDAAINVLDLDETECPPDARTTPTLTATLSAAILAFHTAHALATQSADLSEQVAHRIAYVVSENLLSGIQLITYDGADQRVDPCTWSDTYETLRASFDPTSPHTYKIVISMTINPEDVITQLTTTEETTS